MIPTTPLGDINHEQLMREYEWVRNDDRHYGRSYIEWAMDELDRDLDCVP